MTKILAIDPGNTESGWCVIDARTREPLQFGKPDNRVLLTDLTLDNDLALWRTVDHAVIEMVASYGMAVGADVFETCVWIGRFHEALRRADITAGLVKRHPVKVHHCHDSRAKDSNIVQALVDRFAPGQPNRGKGTKAEPGWFHGFAADIWQAYALAVYVADTEAVTT
ncbi:MAG: hypothetical protein GEU74_12375 [Nitriliruptorales bacterium]|nr:hypothetical protein [Nitriliruptorales bacterium]